MPRNVACAVQLHAGSKYESSWSTSCPESRVAATTAERTSTTESAGRVETNISARAGATRHATTPRTPPLGAGRSASASAPRCPYVRPTYVPRHSSRSLAPCAAAGDAVTVPLGANAGVAMAGRAAGGGALGVPSSARAIGANVAPRGAATGASATSPASATEYRAGCAQAPSRIATAAAGKTTRMVIPSSRLRSGLASRSTDTSNEAASDRQSGQI